MKVGDAVPRNPRSRPARSNRLIGGLRRQQGEGKPFMDKAMEAYKGTNYADCIAFAKRASEVDPNERVPLLLDLQGKEPDSF